MTNQEMLPIRRFLQTMDVVRREGEHLDYSRGRVFGQPVDAQWVRKLEAAPELAERLEAFVSRFGRMQDTMASKLFPRLLQAQAEQTDTLLETLNRLEKLGLLESVDQWLEARNLRNRLVHEYVEDMAKFKQDLKLARDYCAMLSRTNQRIADYAANKMNIAPST